MNFSYKARNYAKYINTFPENSGLIFPEQFIKVGFTKDSKEDIEYKCQNAIDKQPFMINGLQRFIPQKYI